MGLFNFKKEQKAFNGVVFTCRHFMNGEQVTYISHKENGDYECFCSNCSQNLDLNSVMVVGLEEIANTENNKSMFNIEKGKYIYYQDGNWYENTLDKNNEYSTWLFDIEDKIIDENIRRNKELRSDLSGIKINR